MKKNTKIKKPSVPAEVEPDIAQMLNRMQQQLMVISGKIDALIGQSARKPVEGNNLSKPFNNFQRPNNQNERKQNNGFRERTYFKVICADCNKECEVPFKPSGDRPVYCKDCFSKRKSSGGAFKAKTEAIPHRPAPAQHNPVDRAHVELKPKPAEKKKSVSGKKKKRT